MYYGARSGALWAPELAEQSDLALGSIWKALGSLWKALGSVLEASRELLEAIVRDQLEPSQEPPCKCMSSLVNSGAQGGSQRRPCRSPLVYLQGGHHESPCKSIYKGDHVLHLYAL